MVESIGLWLGIISGAVAILGSTVGLLRFLTPVNYLSIEATPLVTEQIEFLTVTITNRSNRNLTIEWASFDFDDHVGISLPVVALTNDLDFSDDLLAGVLPAGEQMKGVVDTRYNAELADIAHLDTMKKAKHGRLRVAHSLAPKAVASGRLDVPDLRDWLRKRQKRTRA